MYSCVHYMDLENQHGRMGAEQAQNCAEFDDPGCTECEKPPCPTLVQQRTGKLLMTLPFAMMVVHITFMH